MQVELEILSHLEACRVKIEDDIAMVEFIRVLVNPNVHSLKFLHKSI